MAYLVLTVALFQFGPIAYPTQDRAWLLLYLMVAFLCIGAGFLSGASKGPAVGRFTHTKNVLLIGGVVSILVLFPSAWAYTGRMPWEVLAAARDQRASYFGLQEQLQLTEGSRNWVILVRMVTQPFSYAALPLGIIFWRRSHLAKFAAISAAVTSLIFSLLRGTDREIGDIIIIAAAALLVAHARAQLSGARLRRFPVKKVLSTVAAGIVLLGAYNLFAHRKADRMGTINAFCLGENSGVCTDYTNPLVASLQDEQKFAVAMVSGYFTNGYYGLGLALTNTYEPTWGLGHSSGLRRFVRLVLGDETISYRTYEYRNRDKGWPNDYVWSTAITALANDVTFPGALAILGAFGFLWARSWINATFGMSNPAAVVFCLCVHTLFYLPANLQVLLTLEGYSTVVVWLTLWRLSSLPRVPRR